VRKALLAFAPLLGDASDEGSRRERPVVGVDDVASSARVGTKVVCGAPDAVAVLAGGAGAGVAEGLYVAAEGKVFGTVEAEDAERVTATGSEHVCVRVRVRE
jgi:hypothetical protein